MRKTDWLTFMKESGLQVWDIWGLESQAEEMQNYRMMSKVEVVEARLGWLRQKGTQLHFKSPTAERRHVLCVGVGGDRTPPAPVWIAGPLQKSRVCPP